jgi:hypothetical protein
MIMESKSQYFSYFLKFARHTGLALMLGFGPSFLHAHVDEGTGNALQLFSYRMEGASPVINGSILSRNVDPGVSDAADEWSEAFTRVIKMTDNSLVTLYIMNNSDTLFIATTFIHKNLSNGTGIRLYFDQGHTGGTHDDTLTVDPATNRGEDMYQFIKGESQFDGSWDGTAWLLDADGQNDCLAAQELLVSNSKVLMQEMAIPLNSLKPQTQDNYDLKVGIEDELGLLIELQKSGSGAGTFYWVETNQDSLDAGAGAGWADLRLDIPRLCFT